MQILPLTGNHDRRGFDCGRPELSDWLRYIARLHQDKGLSRAFVAVLEDATTYICGYYVLALTEADIQPLPEARSKKLPRLILGIRLGRLAVDARYQGKRLGELLLVDALERVRFIHLKWHTPFNLQPRHLQRATCIEVKNKRGMIQ